MTVGADGIRPGITFSKERNHARSNPFKPVIRHAEVTAGRVRRCLVITAGKGNGYLFPAAVLRASLALWEGAECFLDHDLKTRSVKDLAESSTRSPGTRTARASAPSSRAPVRLRPVLAELGKIMLGDDQPKPAVGLFG